MKKRILFALLVLFVVSSCKYDEGPFITIYSKKERIMGNKSFKKVIVNDQDITSQYATQYLEISKSGGFSWLFYNTNSYNPDKYYGGYWELYDSKKKFKMEVFENDTSYTWDWDIVRLTYADFFLERTDEDGNKIRWELYQAY